MPTFRRSDKKGESFVTKLQNEKLMMGYSKNKLKKIKLKFIKLVEEVKKK